MVQRLQSKRDKFELTKISMKGPKNPGKRSHKITKRRNISVVFLLFVRVNN